MNWTIHKTEGQSFIKVVTEGDFNLTDHLKMLEDIVSRDFWEPGMDVLFDHRNLNFGSTDIAYIKDAVRNHEKCKEKIGDAKFAHLMKSVTDYGRGRQFQMLAENRINASLHICLDEKEAIFWLTS